MNAISLSNSVFILLLSAWSCREIQTKSREDSGKFPVTRPIVLDTTYTKEYVADIHSLQNVEIRSRVKGFIDKIHVDEGQTVKAGQPLFTLNSQEFREQLLQAKAQTKSAQADLKAAEVEVQNATLLVEKKVVSKTQLDQANAKVEALQAKVEEMKANEANAGLQLSFAEIRAPFDGIINRIPLKTGSLADEGTLLTTLSNNKEVFAYFNMSEREYLDFTLNRRTGEAREVGLILANGYSYPYTGKVETVEGEFDKGTGNIAFRARFANPEQLLKNGGTGKIQLTSSIKKALIIPQKATFEVQDKFYVYVVGFEGKIKSHNIRIAQRLPQLYILESGLDENDKIMLEGVQNVKDGDAIQDEPIPMKKVLAQLKTQN